MFFLTFRNLFLHSIIYCAQIDFFNLWFSPVIFKGNPLFAKAPEDVDQHALSKGQEDNGDW